MKLIDELKELEAKAAPGPWAWAGESKKEDDINGSDGYAVICRDSGVYPPDPDTGDLIIAMRNCLPDLIDELSNNNDIITHYSAVVKQMEHHANQRMARMKKLEDVAHAAEQLLLWWAFAQSKGGSIHISGPMKLKDPQEVLKEALSALAAKGEKS